MPISEHYKAAPQFQALGADFADAVEPADFPQAKLRYWNDRWAENVGLELLNAAEREAHFHRFEPLPDNQSTPLAVRYHGHQFRTYNPQIGDGRGFLFAQLKDSKDRLLDLGTKGSGQTPYSRNGDGRLTLKGAVREILATEMLEALGVYTSKTLSVFETGEELYRGDEPSPTRSAVMTRLQHSHVRFGMFQRHAHVLRPDLIQALVDYSLSNLFPDVEAGDDEARIAVFLERVVDNSARLAAEWMAAGFVHGVLNTDNLVVTGESFDYGPWRFLPYFEPGFTAAYFDETGLYAYARQPESVFWALQQLASTLATITDSDPLLTALNRFPEQYKQELPRAFFRRLGVKTRDVEQDAGFVRDLLNAIQDRQTPWEAVFFDWFGGPASESRAMKSARAEHYRSDVFKPVIDNLRSLEPDRPERLDHAYFSDDDPLHMTIDVVEDLWAPIAEHDDWSRFHQVLDRIGQARQAYDLGMSRDGFWSGSKI